MVALLTSCDAYDASLLLPISQRDSGLNPLPYVESCGDGELDPDEGCDPGIAEGEEGACPTSCPSEDACAPQVPAGPDCGVECVTLPITKALNGDGCCPEGVGPTEDSDCGACGDEIVGPTETCDPPERCPVADACLSPDSCLLAVFAGDAATCNASCRFQPVATCQDDDGCCPAGCSAASDSDCSVTCGNGVVEPDKGETCETDDPAQPCPADCADVDACTDDLLTGSASNCNVQCTHVSITEPVHGDGCCPPGENSINDSDCGPACGNEVVEGGEACDPCPASCADQDVCTADQVSGSAAECTLVCTHAAITSPASGDGCCPAGANTTTDSDCAPLCGNLVKEGSENCDPCPSSCSDGVACTTDGSTGSAAACSLQCTHAAITAPSNGDMCCPSGANAANDSDCTAQCGNGATEPGEECDGGPLCSSCNLLFHSSLVHRYTFNGTGTTITDSVGTAHGTAVNCSVANGAIDLQSSVSGDYVNLPDGLISSLDQVTFEVWLDWDGGADRQRIFDFGYSTGTVGTSFFMAEPANSNEKLASYVNFTSATSDAANDWPVTDTTALPTGIRHVAVTFNGTRLSLYLDGVRQSYSDGSAKSLSSIDDRNNWLGRSQFSADPELDAILYEFRIYSTALTTTEVQASFSAGQNPTP